MSHRLDAIAEQFGLRLQGPGEREIVGVCALEPGVADRLTYCNDPRLATALANTQAGAVIVNEQLAERCPTSLLIADNPRLAFAEVATLFEPPPPPTGVHPSAIVAENASLADNVSVGARAVVGAGAIIADGARLEPGCVIGAGARIGAATRVGSNACVEAGVKIGARVLIGPAAVIGARGFGLEHDGQGWRAIPQLGSVHIADDVEIGAGCTIDRGAIEDTVLDTGVKLDDQVHIAHNCRIGAHTVIAGCTGIAGSCTIGRNCILGGAVGIGDHVTIADGVILTGAAQVTQNIDQAGMYSSNFRAMPERQWRKRLALFRRLDETEQRLRQLERGQQQ